MARRYAKIDGHVVEDRPHITLCVCVCVCVCVWEGEYVETGNGAKIDGHVVEVRPHITVCVCVCVCVWVCGNRKWRERATYKWQ